MTIRKRHRVIDPRKARAAAMGGMLNHAAPYPSPEKCCGKCQLPRYSVDASGVCDPCRVTKHEKPGVAEGGVVDGTL